MKLLPHLFAQNRSWAESITRRDPEFFPKLSRQQKPEFLWIGCADSRVPANEIIGLMPGEVFVHRNIANVVVHTDLNCLSVLQYAIDVLQVRHVMVVGHYGCAGVTAALKGERVGLADNWLRHVQDVKVKHQHALGPLPDDSARGARLCELNVVEQAVHVAQTSIVQDAWARGQELAIHGWVYGLRDGLLRDLDITASGAEELESNYLRALRGLGA